jgi:hypothetical protein
MVKVYNSKIYRSIEIEDNPKSIIINCKAFDNIDIMFYTGVTAYPWFPDVNVIDSLSELGYQFYAFNSHSEYVLPEKVKVNPNVILINEALK